MNENNTSEYEVTPDNSMFDEVLEEMAAESEPDDDRIPVLIVDDDSVMRRGLSRLIAADTRLRVVGEAANGEDAVELARTLRPEVIVMDVRMPFMDGIEATRRIKDEYPSVIVIGASAYCEEEHKTAMLEAGACVFLDKTGVGDALPRAINRCLIACGLRPSSCTAFGGYCSCARPAAVAVTA